MADDMLFFVSVHDNKYSLLFKSVTGRKYKNKIYEAFQRKLASEIVGLKKLLLSVSSFPAWILSSSTELKLREQEPWGRRLFCFPKVNCACDCGHALQILRVWTDNSVSSSMINCTFCNVLSVKALWNPVSLHYLTRDPAFSNKNVIELV